MEVDRERVFTMFSEGMSVNAVAGALRVSWYDAKKLQKEWEQQDKPAHVHPAVAAMHKEEEETAPDYTKFSEPEPEQPASTAPDDSTDETWDVTLTIPSGRVDDILATFTTQEKFNAIAFVLQKRMDEALEG